MVLATCFFSTGVVHIRIPLIQFHPLMNYAINTDTNYKKIIYFNAVNLIGVKKILPL